MKGDVDYLINGTMPYALFTEAWYIATAFINIEQLSRDRLVDVNDCGRILDQRDSSVDAETMPVRATVLSSAVQTQKN